MCTRINVCMQTCMRILLQVAALNAGQLRLEGTPQQLQHEQAPGQASHAHEQAQSQALPVTSMDLYFSTLLSAFEEIIKGDADVHEDVRTCAEAPGVMRARARTLLPACKRCRASFKQIF